MQVTRTPFDGVLVDCALHYRYPVEIKVYTDTGNAEDRTRVVTVKGSSKAPSGDSTLFKVPLFIFKSRVCCFAEKLDYSPQKFVRSHELLNLVHVQRRNSSPHYFFLLIYNPF